MNSSTMYYSFNNTRLNFLHLFPIIMSHPEKSEYMAPLLSVIIVLYKHACIFMLYVCTRICWVIPLSRFIKVSFYLRWRLWNNNLPKTDRQDFKKQQIRFSIWITCSLHTLLSSPRDFRVYKVTKAALCTQPYWQHFPQCTETQSLNRKSGLKRLLNERCTTAISPNAN